jgi:transposase
MVHVGVDLHKHTSQVAVLREDGELTRHRLVNDGERVRQFFAELPPKTPVAIEASGTWWWLVDLFESLGHQPVLSHPKQTKAIASARLKNDRVDADRLVRQCKNRALVQGSVQRSDGTTATVTEAKCALHGGQAAAVDKALRAAQAARETRERGER